LSIFMNSSADLPSRDTHSRSLPRLRSKPAPESLGDLPPELKKCTVSTVHFNWPLISVYGLKRQTQVVPLFQLLAKTFEAADGRPVVSLFLSARSMMRGSTYFE